MAKFNVDYSSLDTTIHKRAYKLSDVKDRLEVVGFDIVRFKDNDKGADLWQVQSADDGEYIVALYQTEDEIKSADWEVAVNKTAGSLQVSYKGDPLVVVASDKIGIPADQLHKVVSYLPEKLASNKRLVQSLLSELSDSAKKLVLNKYPELS